jgi:long-chain acyl-CoA synthetase
VFGSSSRNIDLAHQSVEVPAGSGIYRDARFPDRFLTEFIPGTNSFYDYFEKATTAHADRPCYGTRTADGFQWVTYGQFRTRVLNTASGMVHAGVAPGGHVGIYAKNRLEWQIVSEACHQQGMVSCALYDTLGAESSVFIANHAELDALCFAAESFDKVVSITQQCPRIRVLIQFEPLTAAQVAQVPSHARLFSLADVESQGTLAPIPSHPVAGSEISILMYTSGSTGDPKGVAFSFNNLSAVAAGVLSHLQPVTSEEVFLSFLPLAHILERACEFALFGLGAQVGFWSGDVKLLTKDIAALRPTLFAAVPRVYDRIYDGIRSEVAKAGGLKQKVFEFAYQAKLHALKNGYTTAPYDALVFNAVRAKFGGRMRQLLSGGAPLRASVQEFMAVVVAPIAIGMGLTETSASAMCSYPEDMHVGRVGPPVPSTEIRLVDVPEMDYFVKDGAGELWIRGPAVTRGYYRNEAATRESWTEDNWFKTGDIARRDPDGAFLIVDRKKNIVKTAQGEYVALEKVEGVMAQVKSAMMVWAYADSEQPFIVAVIVANPEEFTAKYGAEASTPEGLARLCASEDVRKAVLADMEKVGRASGLTSLEIPKRVHIEPNQWTVESQLITPTMKPSRPKLRKHYQSIINKLYSEA